MVFVKDYCHAFATGGGKEIGQFYNAPCSTVRGDGSLHVFSTRDEIEQFFDSVVTTYRDEGMGGVDCGNPVTEELDTGCTRLTCEWVMQDAELNMIRRWQQTYIFQAADEEWRIIVAIFHAN